MLYQKHVHRRLTSVGIVANLKLVAVNNTIQKPGPVFNAIARVAYDSGTDYIYRVNDDSEFLDPWAVKFVNTIQVTDIDLCCSAPTSLHAFRFTNTS